MTVTTLVITFLALTSVAAVGACGRPAPPPEPAVDTAAINRAREDSIRMENQRREAAAAEALRRAREDSIARANAAAEEARRNSEMLRGQVMASINFDFDKSDLRDDTNTICRPSGAHEGSSFSPSLVSCLG